MSKVITAPTMYVGFNSRTEDGNKVKLGFATYLPLNETKQQQTAYEKRKETVDRWHQVSERIHTKDGWVEVATELEQELLDNSVPLDDFKIAQSVRRYGWGGGNVLWRIADPRGFEVEISSANMASILDTCTLVNGTIQAKCVYGWTGGKVVLLPEHSQPYTDAQQATSDATSVVSAKDVAIGDMVRLKNGVEGEWCGMLHYVKMERCNDLDEEPAYRYSIIERTYMTPRPSTRASGFILTDQGIHIMSSPKFAKILTPTEKLNTKVSGSNKINEALKRMVKQETSSAPVVMTSPVKIKADGLTTTIEATDQPYTPSYEMWWLRENVYWSARSFDRHEMVMDVEILQTLKVGPKYLMTDIDVANNAWHSAKLQRRTVPKVITQQFTETQWVPDDYRTEMVSELERVFVVLCYDGSTFPIRRNAY